MNTIRIAPGAGAQTLDVEIFLDAGGRNVTPLTSASANLAAFYRRDDGLPVAIALTSATFAHVAQGIYKLVVPAEAFAAGAARATVFFAEAADIKAEAYVVLFDVATSTRGTSTLAAGDVPTATAIAAAVDAGMTGSNAAQAAAQATLAATRASSILTAVGTLATDAASAVWTYAVGAGRTLAAAYDRAKTAAKPDEVSPSIAFAPVINPTPVTVTPTFNVPVPDVIFTPTINPPAVTVSGGFLAGDRTTLTTISSTLTTMSITLGTLSNSTSTIGGNIDALLAMTTGEGTSRAFRTIALSAAPTGGNGSGGGVIAGPAYAALPAGLDLRVASRIVLAQGAATRLPIDVFDAFTAPLTLAGRSLRFVMFDANRTVVGQVNAGRITLDDVEPNRCYVDVLPADVPASGPFRWVLWDRTDVAKPFELGRGALILEPAAIGV